MGGLAIGVAACSLMVQYVRFEKRAKLAKLNEKYLSKSSLRLRMQPLTNIHFHFDSITARSLSRAKEVGLRKTIGAGQDQLIGQFLAEAFLYIPSTPYLQLP
ncbi:hypothetical protein GCM10027291_35400 [Telluribacter humicola]